MTLPDLFCDAFRVLLITQMIHSPFTVPSAKKGINRVIQNISSNQESTLQMQMKGITVIRKGLY